MIEKLKIKNFKKFAGDIEYEFSFKEGLNVIIGENNAGKTTVLNILKAYIDNDGKYFKFLSDKKDLRNEDKPEIEVTEDGVSCKLLTSAKTWKFDKDEHEGIAYGYISANASLKEIKDSLQNAYISYVLSDGVIKSQLAQINSRFQNDINVAIARTEILKEEGDVYDLIFPSDLSKIAVVDFDGTNPKAISNKGLGQQKEFLINFFIEKNTLKHTDTLLIDEVENSLSIDTIDKIIGKIKQTHQNKQFFFTTHNPATLGDGLNVNIISIGVAPKGVIKGFVDVIFCEGTSDQLVFGRIWPHKVFINCVGGNIIGQTNALNSIGKPMKAIVDGDAEGLLYKAHICANDPKNRAHSLNDGCVEDYYIQQSIDDAYASLGMTPPTTKSRDLLHNPPISTKNERKDFKNHIHANGTIDTVKLFAELDSFVNS